MRTRRLIVVSGPSSWRVAVLLAVLVIAGCKQRLPTSQVKAEDVASAVLTAPRSPAGATVVHRLVRDLQLSFLVGTKLSDVRAQMVEHLKVLNLADANGRLVAKARQYETELFQGSESAASINAFLERLADANAQNPYLVDFLERADLGRFKELSYRLGRSPANPRPDVGDRLDAKSVMPAVLAYALLLENLSRLLRQDVAFLEYCRQVWAVRLASSMSWLYYSPFETKKLLVLNQLGDEYLAHQQSGHVPSDFGIDIIRDNILVAVEFDAGNAANIEVGEFLAAHPPGSQARPGEPETPPAGRAACAVDGTDEPGATVFAEDGVGMLFSPPLPERWADLYSVWNLNFIATYENWPFFFVKLLIPYVAGHHGDCHSKEFLHRRGMALLVHAHFELIGRALSKQPQGPRNIAPLVRWFDTDLRAQLGESNRRALQLYKAQLTAACRSRSQARGGRCEGSADAP